MKIEMFEMPVQPSGFHERPSVTALEVQSDGSLLAGVSLAHPLVQRIKLEANQIEFEDLGVEEATPQGFAVLRGLRGNPSGDTAFAVLEPGMLPGFVIGLMGADLKKKSGPDLREFIRRQEGTFGAYVRHTILQIVDGELRVRRSREAGTTLDVAHIGDFIFGLTQSAIWREPYLNAEKRETLRSDLDSNGQIHRDADGNFWLLGENDRLLRVNQTDIKAKRTLLKTPLHGFEVSCSSSTDGWLYGTCGESKTLFRVRLNPVSNEEEMQTVGELPRPISAMVAVDRAEGASFLLIALEDPTGVQFQALDLIKPEDPELLPAVPALRALPGVPQVKCLGTLSVDLRDETKPVVWGGEGRLGWGDTSKSAPALVRLSEF